MFFKSRDNAETSKLNRLKRELDYKNEIDTYL